MQTVLVRMALSTRDTERDRRTELPEKNDGNACAPRRPCRHAPSRGSRPLPSLLFRPLYPCTPASKAASAAQRRAPATRACRPEGAPATRA
eukprot:6184665-Pyramimonas_sp.AAC.1